MTVLTGMAGALAFTASASGVQPYETYEGTVFADEPVAQYRFNDAVGSSTLGDSWGRDTGTSYGVTFGEPGPFGGSKSGSFSGTAYASLSSDPLAGDNEFTVEAWVHRTAGETKLPIFDFGSSSTNYMYLTPASSLTGHKMLFEIHTSSGTIVQVTAPKLAEAVWEYVALTETSSGRLTLYVDGKEVGEASGVTVTPASLGSLAYLYLGRSISESRYYLGKLSNIGFYDKALSAERILAHYDAAEFPVVSSLPTVSGIVKQGKTLTAKAGSWSGLEPFSFGYKWLRCNPINAKCANIAGATGSSYTLANEDVGHTIGVEVAASNRAGGGNATSEQTVMVEGLPPVNSTSPTVAGTAEVGQLLIANVGAWEGSTPQSYSYEWELCHNTGAGCTVIAGASEAGYRVQGSQLDHTLRVIVTASNTTGNKSVTSAATAVVGEGPSVNTALPAVLGEAKAGQTLTASKGEWAGSEPLSYAYQWQSCNASGEGCSNISEATDSSYPLTASNVGSTMRVVVTAKNTVGSASASSPVSAVVVSEGPPSNTERPAITGRVVEGQALTVSDGSWTGAPPINYTYQWQRCSAGVFGSAGDEAGQLSQPADVAVAANGDLWVIDRGNNRVEEFSGTGEYLRQFGSAGSGNGQLLEPAALAIDASGDIWVADTYNNRVEEFSPSDEYMRQLHTLGAEGGQLEAPEGVAIERNGDVWVSDSGAGQLAVFSPGGEYLRTVGTEGVEPGQLGRPEGLVVDSHGDVWVADWFNDRVEEFSEAGEYLQELGSQGSEDGELEQPDAVAVGLNGDVWVGDVGNNRIEEFSEHGTYLSQFGAEGSGPGQFGLFSPMGLAIIANGDIWVTDAENDRLEEFDEHDEYVKTNCADIPGATSDTYDLTAADVGSELRAVVTATNAYGEASTTSPATVAVAPAPPANTELPTIEGTAQDGEALEANPGTWTGAEPIFYSYQWEICNSGGEACTNIEGAEGVDYVLGHGDVGKTLRVIVTAENESGEVGATSSATSVVAAAPPVNTARPTIAGKAKEGQTLTASTGTWTGTPPLTYSYQWQSCNALGEGCIPIAGATNPTYLLGPGAVGTTLDVVVTATSSRGSTEASAAASAVVIADTPEDTALPQISGTPEEGQMLTVSDGSWSGAEPITYAYQWQRCTTGTFGSAGSGDGQFEHPADVAVVPNGDFWVIDRDHARIEQFSDTGEYLSQFGTPGSGEGQIADPTALAIGLEGDIWVADAINDRVEEFSPSGSFIRQFGSQGSASGQLNSPEGIAVDAHGDVWVSDTGNARLEEFGSSGEYLKTVGTKGSEPGQLIEPEALAIGSDGHIWVPDWVNDRVEEYGANGEYLQQFGSEGSGDGQLERPDGIAVSSNGDVWVADTGNDRIERFGEHGEYLSQFGSRGSGPGQFGLGVPTGLALSNTDLWVTDAENNRIEEFSESGEYRPHQCTDIAGATSQSYTAAAADAGSQLQAVVTAADAYGETSATSPPTAVVGPMP